MAFKMKGFPMHNTSALKNYNTMSKYSSKSVKFGEDEKDPAFKQTDGDLKEWLLGEKGFSQEEADQMITSGAYTTSNEDFLAWYNKRGETQDLAEERVDAPVEDPPVEGSAMNYKSPMAHAIPEPFEGNYGQAHHNMDFNSDTSEGKKEHYKRHKH